VKGKIKTGLICLATSVLLLPQKKKLFISLVRGNIISSSNRDIQQQES
jgi:hypothetical protein